MKLTKLAKISIGCLSLITITLLILGGLVLNQTIMIVDSSELDQLSNKQNPPSALILTLQKDELALVYGDKNVYQTGTHFIPNELIRLYNKSPQKVSLRDRPVYIKSKEKQVFALNLTVGYQLIESEIPFVAETSVMPHRIWHKASNESQDLFARYLVREVLANQPQQICTELKQELTKEIREFGYQLTDFVLEDVRRGFFPDSTSSFTPIDDIILIKQGC
ncbi:SPFH domain-containing protein [Vibrio intestinalis]|uniref:SPFH domain-containing protein n=1 Tax=Vibrio intestinalis TaxID=2933291 RepID=UPI0021A8D96D|nr:SPFH domain-containing protein [Vibrio intestinalis]